MLTEDGSNVDVKVTLGALDGFVNTGAGDWLFFSLSNFLSSSTQTNAGITITNLPVNLSWESGDSHNQKGGHVIGFTPFGWSG